MQKELIDIRCPFKVKGRADNKVRLCNRVCVKVLPGSAGEAYCKDCKMAFEFEVDRQALMMTGVRVKPVGESI